MNQFPQQGFNQPAPQPQFQAPQFTAPYNAPAQQQQYAQPGPAGQAAQQGPTPIRGSLGQGWDQGASAGGHGTAVKFAQQGSVFSGVVARDMVDSDCRQATDPGTKQPKFFRKSGAPQFEYKIPCNVQASPEYPEGKATLFTSKYKLHSAVVQAMIQAGFQAGEGLREGDLLEVQRIADVTSGMGNPGHDFVARVTRREAIVATSAPAPSTVNQNAGVAAQVEYSQPVQAPVQASAPTGSPVLTAEQQSLVTQYGIQPQG